MIADNNKSASVGSRGISISDFAQTRAQTRRPDPEPASKLNRRVAFQTSGKLFSPTSLFVWIIALLGVAACIAPRIPRGWFWFELAASTVAILASYDALRLWRVRNECVPALLLPEKGLRGTEGQTMPVPLAITSSSRQRLGGEVVAAIMPATAES